MTGLTVVVLTYNRLDEVIITVRHLCRIAAAFPVIVVDNASADGTADYLEHHFPSVRVIRAPHNLGAAGRNLGVEFATTPYVALCDDDTRWDAGALERAVAILDAAPQTALLTADVFVGSERRPDPACIPMASSPLGTVGAWGHRVLPFRQAGGFWQPFFIGGEEDLLALDLADAGWDLVYTPAISISHYPSSLRDNRSRMRLVLRNAIWLAWLRLPWRAALRHTLRTLRQALKQRLALQVMVQSLYGFSTVVRQRRVVSEHVAAMWNQTRG